MKDLEMLIEEYLGKLIEIFAGDQFSHTLYWNRSNIIFIVLSWVKHHLKMFVYLGWVYKLIVKMSNWMDRGIFFPTVDNLYKDCLNLG